MGNPAHYVDLTPQWKSDGSPELNFTAEPEANQLLADDPNAFLIGIVLDQQIPTTKAFAGPHVLKQRLGHFDIAKIAAMDQEQFIEVFREKPAVHRFPASMGKRDTTPATRWSATGTATPPQSGAISPTPRP